VTFFAAFGVLVLSGVLVLREERVVLSLLFKTGDEVPERSRLIHVCNRWHDCGMMYMVCRIEDVKVGISDIGMIVVGRTSPLTLLQLLYYSAISGIKSTCKHT
jgi:hypothetical protein